MKVNRRDSINIELSVREAWLLRDLLFEPALSSTSIGADHRNFAERFSAALKANLADTTAPEVAG